jgi:catechol 2,3-dioxygenase-like lactoylglutathione lyase family enzyme
MMFGPTSAALTMASLHVTEIKAFVPAKDFELSKRFYQDLGFTMASDGGGVAYFHLGAASFLLQDFCVPALAENFMMHILVEDVDAWHRHALASGVTQKYGVRITAIETQPWRMRDFCLFDPSGVLWRIGQNVD